MSRRHSAELARESSKTQKTREKLRKRLEEIDKSVTPQALQQKLSEIHRWISRNSTDRLPLKSKAISLFDANEHAASASNKVKKLGELLHQKMVLTADSSASHS